MKHNLSYLAEYGSVGMDYGEYVGAELRIGAGNNGSVSGGGLDYKARIDHFYSYLGKVQVPLSEGFKIYGLAGASTIKGTVTVTTPGATFPTTGTNTISGSDTKASFGGGIDYQDGHDWHIGAEYMRYSPNIQGFTLNLKYVF